MMLTAFPDLEMTVESMLADGDTVYYTAGNRLWRAPLAGGEVEAVADHVAEIFARFDDIPTFLVAGTAGQGDDGQLLLRVYRAGQFGYVAIR